ncbi:hypothetical protein HDU67_002893 [Dinochytrium kinnereticum]|nr:hypothetical protein HDU67_002893 [Dinochytrium kinnereticum]
MVVSPSAHLTSLAQEVSLSITSKEFAAFLDQTDELKDLKLRDEFHFPKVSSIRNTSLKSSKTNNANQEDLRPVDDLTLDSECVYMIGNSLGLQPRRTREILNQELDVWAEKGVNGHFDHPHGRPWVSIDNTVIEESAKLVGAMPEEVAIMNSLTANLHFLMVAFYRPTATKFKIIMEAKAFPSDYFALASQVKFHGYDPKTAIIEVKPRENEYSLRLEDILDVIQKEGDATALVLFSGVQYYTGQYFNLKAITEAAKEKGCTVGFDLAHAIGNVPVKLHDWNVDFACWCTYKYLNAGPGGIGGAFVHSRHAKADLNRFAGWWGTNPTEKFAMDNIFRAIPGAAGYRLSNPSVVSTVSLLGSLEVFAKTSIDKLRQKSLSLTGYLEILLDALGSDSGFKILTPRDPFSRGCQLSLFFENNRMEEVFHKLCLQGVIGDERKPDVIRISPAPLYCTFMDTQVEVWHAVGSGPFTKRGTITYDPDSKKKTTKYESEPDTPFPEALLNTYPEDEVYRVMWKHTKPVFGVKDVTLNASVRMCLLQASKFQEHYSIHIDQAGKVSISIGIPFHLDYVVDASSCQKSKVQAPKAGIKAQCSVARTSDGARPHLEMIQETKDGKPEPEKSFLQKYWYYIVAIALVLMLSGGDGK